MGKPKPMRRAPHQTADGKPLLSKVIGGWFAHGDGWAVFGETAEAALQKHQEAEALHVEIMSRPDPEGGNTDAGR